MFINLTLIMWIDVMELQNKKTERGMEKSIPLIYFIC